MAGIMLIILLFLVIALSPFIPLISLLFEGCDQEMVVIILMPIILIITPSCCAKPGHGACPHPVIDHLWVHA